MDNQQATEASVREVHKRFSTSMIQSNWGEIRFPGLIDDRCPLCYTRFPQEAVGHGLHRFRPHQLAGSTLGLDGATVGGSYRPVVDESETVRTVRAAADPGIAFIDTAPLCGLGRARGASAARWPTAAAGPR
jgi:hypothetical protein